MNYVDKLGMFFFQIFDVFLKVLGLLQVFILVK